MLVLHGPSLVIFANTKTGSTALATALADHAAMTVRNPPLLRHMDWGRYKAVMQPMLRKAFPSKSFETVALMREPTDWMGSWYRYRMRPSLDGSPRSTKGVTFNEYISAALQPDPPELVHRVTQLGFLGGKAGRVQINHVFDYARFDQFVAWLSDRLGAEITLQRENVSPEGDLTLEPRLRDRFQAVRQREFALYERVAHSGHLRTA